MSSTPIFKRPFQFGFSLLAWLGVIWYFFQMVIFREPGTSFAAGLLSYLSYFTIQTNLIVAVWWSVSVIHRNDRKTPWILQPRVKGAITTYITVTLLGYAVLLAHTWDPQGLHLFFSTLTHYIIPLAFILDWVLFEHKGIYQWRYALDWLVYPVVYFVYAMLHGAVTGDYLYPFFNPVTLGWGGLAVQVSFILAFFIILECIYIGVNRRLNSSPLQLDS